VQVGILGGTGPLGRGLALRLAAGGTRVSLGSRDADRARQVVADLLQSWPEHSLDLKGTSNAEAAEEEVILAATPWEAAVPTLDELRERLGGKVVVSVANALVKKGNEVHALLMSRGSVAAEIQAALPDTWVAAAGHHLPASTLTNLKRDLEADVLVCSDHPAATSQALELFGRIKGLRPLDAGSLASASAIEAFTAVIVTVNMRYKAHSSLRLAGLDHVTTDT